MVMAAGFPEMIVGSIEEYEKRAIYLGNNVDELRMFRDMIETTKYNMPLFDTNQFVKDLEKGYRHVWGEFIEGRKFESFNVSDL
jgi:predicted O-linked N-acetylglucosamine transferase (SPINDLY family)